MFKNAYIYSFIIIIVSALSLLAMINGIATKSLLMDEAFFARNLDLFPNGLFIGSAPSAPLYYTISYLLVSIFGKTEWVYRLFPLISVILGLGLVITFLRKVFSEFIAFFGCIIILTSVPLINYAGYGHPYGTDFLFSILLLIITYHILERPSRKSWFLWLGASIFGICFSYPALFVVISYGMIILYYDVVVCKENAEIRRKWIGLCILAILSLIIIFTIFLKQSRITGSFFIQNHPEWYPESFFPQHVVKWAFLSTVGLINQFFFNYQGGLVGLFLLILGMANFILKKETKLLFLCITPIFLSLIGALFYKWVYSTARTMLFSVPFFLILLVSGVEFLWNSTRTRLSRMVISLAVILLPIPQSYILTRGFKHTEDGQEAVRSLSQVVKPRIREDDCCLVYYTADVHFRFYFPEHYNSAIIQPWSHRGHPDSLQRFIEFNIPDTGKRFWLFFSKVHYNEDRIMISTAEKTCALLESYEFNGCKALLFDCNKHR